MNNIKQNLLLIDDDADLRTTLKALLENDEYTVTACATAREASALLSKNKYCTILLDIFLPDKNGLEFISEIKQTDLATPIVVITASSTLDLAQQALRLGVFDYLVKPFKHGQLRQVIRNAVIKNKLIEEQQELETQKLIYQKELEQTIQRKVKELQESELKYKSLVEQSLVGVFILQDGKFIYVNRTICETLECAADLLISNSVLLDFIHPDDQEKVNKNMKDVEEGNVDSIQGFQCSAITKKGNERVLKLWFGSILYKGKRALEGIMIDATEEVKAKEREKYLQLELMTEHKLAAIGQLAAGISHNLNTPIAIIQANAELLKMKHPDMKEADKILQQTQRMAQLINTILSKGRKEQERAEVVIDLNELIQQELEFLNANLYFKHHIEKEFHFDPNLPKIRGVYSDFSQGITNIIQNAIDAMYQAPVRKLTITTQWDGEKIEIKISDTGHGIPEEIRSKIFDPFFTTKPKQDNVLENPDAPHGTGLGLSSAYNLLSSYGVKISFHTELEQGTTFILSIPVRKDTSS